MNTSQIISLILACIVVIFEIRWMFKNKEVWIVAIPELSWLIHVVIFYLSLMFGWWPHGEYSWWSSGLRFHAVITIFLLVLYRNVGKGWRSNGK